MINNTQLNDADINRCSLLTQHLNSSSVSVKRVLFKSFCLCMYGVALWTNFTMKSYKRMKASYVKCLKIFFGYSRCDSVTTMLAEIDIPDFDSVINNFKCFFKATVYAMLESCHTTTCNVTCTVVCMLIFCWK